MFGFGLSVLLLILSYSTAYGHEIVTHQHIAREAIDVWEDVPQELKDYASKENIGRYENVSAKCIFKNSCADYDEGDDIIVGSAEEDATKITDRKNNIETLSVSEHFWNPDLFDEHFELDVGATFRSSLVSFGSCLSYGGAFERAKELYDTAKFLYALTDFEQSYYVLGKVAHLLTDLAVPAHVHNDIHTGLLRSFIIKHCSGKGPSAEDDAFEQFMGKRKNISKYILGKGKELGSKEYNPDFLPNIPPDFDWSVVLKEVTPIGKLFYYVAQKTQYFASDGDIFDPEMGSGDNGLYARKDGTESIFVPNLWEGEVAAENIVSQPRQIESLNGKDNKIGLNKAAEALVPHAIKAVAGLYRLFWMEVNASDCEIPQVGALIYLCFIQGDPKNPGDNIIISTPPEEFGDFYFAKPISLAGVKNGLALNVYPRTDSTLVDGWNITTGWGIRGRPECGVGTQQDAILTAPVNGIHGYSIIESQRSVEMRLDSIKDFVPSCSDITIEELELIFVSLFNVIPSPILFVLELDAVSMEIFPKEVPE